MFTNRLHLATFCMEILYTKITLVSTVENPSDGDIKVRFEACGVVTLGGVVEFDVIVMVLSVVGQLLLLIS